MFENLSFTKKIWSIGAIVLAFFISLSVYFALEQKDMMINEKKSKLINLTEVAYSIIENEYKLFTQGVIDEQTAKKNAIDAIKKLRYNGADYYWINDNKLPYPTMIMHPTAPTLDGKELNNEKFNCATKLEFGGDSSKSQNTDGKKNLFQSFAEVTNSSNIGFVTYMWTKPKVGGGATEELYPKLSCVKGFSHWQWIVGTGIYIDDVNEQFYTNIIKLTAIITLILIVLTAIFIIVIKNLSQNIEHFSSGLKIFFAFLKKETSKPEFITINSKDEFGEMANIVNESIKQIEEGLIKDNEAVNETLKAVEKAKLGYLDIQINASPSNPQLIQLKDAINEMAKAIKTNIDSIQQVLNEYGNFKFTSQIDTKNIQGDVAELIKNINFTTNEISKLLQQSLSIGQTLDVASDNLIKNVDILSRSSNEAAAALEETAAALEEITSTVVNNANNVVQMSKYSTEVTNSAKKGQQLARSTTAAMDEITSQVNLINESITVIDQIAFQTNILSLNAAVEAATAGEAGKGFAVVAAEVRNLASRSAEAAKEIKSIVENATNKASQGKTISNEMIKGYDELLENIHKTTQMIEEISNSSKEQEAGITQINDAVAGLDQQTQQNASIANQTREIALQTDVIAKEIVNDAMKKEFIGKKDNTHS